MSMFNKFLGRKEDSPPKNSSQKSPDTNISGGFLCPLCYLSFENSDLLTTHFNKEHDEQTSYNSLNSSFSDQNESASLKKTSSRSSFNPKIESILKKYVDTDPNNTETTSITSELNESSKSNVEAELKTWKEQLQMSEETRLTLSSDLLQYQDENKQMALKLKKLNSEREKYDEKLQSITNELSVVKSINAQLKSEKEAIGQNSLLIQEEFINKSQKLTELENELASRPTIDDLNLLKNEIVRVQSLTETIVKEKESIYIQLFRDYNNLKSMLEIKDEEIRKTTERAESLKELDELRQTVQTLLDHQKTNETKENDYKFQIQSGLEQIELKDIVINDLNLSLSQLRGEISSKDSRIQNLEIEMKELIEQQTQLRESVNELETKKTELNTKLETFKHSKERSMSQKETDFEELGKEKETLEVELNKFKVKVQVHSDEKIQWLNEKNEFISMKQALENQNLELESRFKQSENEKNKLKSDIEALNKKIESLNNEISTLKKLKTDLQSNLEILEKKLAEAEILNVEKIEQIEQINMDALEVKLDNQVLNDEIDKFKSLMEEKELIMLESEKKLTSLNEQMLVFRVEKAQLIEKNDKLEEDLKNLRLEIEEISTASKILKEKFDVLEIENSGLKEQIKQEVEQKGSLVKHNSELSEHVDELKSNEEKIKTKLLDLERSSSVIESNNRDLLKNIDVASKENAIFKTSLINLKKAEAELNKNNETLSLNLENVIKEMERVKLERDECETLRLDSGKKYELNMKALNQNLANLRVEIKQQNEKLEKTETIINSIKGDNLEMEAKLSNCMDDRNQLLERCLISEKLLESIKNQNVELKRRLEDTQSALQELGREHQELQIQNYKKSNYKWVDDRLVKDCFQCKKVFTVTIRKHHCRNCGEVYCYECSDHTAIVSSSAKPQRVCKACFIELNN